MIQEASFCFLWLTPGVWYIFLPWFKLGNVMANGWCLSCVGQASFRALLLVVLSRRRVLERPYLPEQLLNKEF